jgi:hypothetical protein
LVLAVFVMELVGALFHLVIVAHVFLEDGRIAEIDPFTGDSVPENQRGNPLDEGCPYLLELTTANTYTSRDVVAVFVARSIEHTVTQDLVTEVFRAETVYRLSPSNSPPLVV